FGQQLVDGIVKIQAEVRRRIQAALEEGARERGRFADIRLQDDVVDHLLLFRRALLFGQEKFIQGVVDGRELSKTLAAETVDALCGRERGSHPPQVRVITGKVRKEPARQFRPLWRFGGRYLLDRRMQVFR